MSAAEAARRILSTAMTARMLKSLGVEAGDGLVAFGSPIVTLAAGSTIQIGRGVVLCSDPRSTALGVSRPVMLRTLRHSASIRIGDRVGLSGTVVCAAASVSIGSDCPLGADVMIVDINFHPLSPIGRRSAPIPHSDADDPVSIADNVFLGTRSIVLPGATIGANSVIGAGSIVSENIPAGVIAAGNPCRYIRDL